MGYGGDGIARASLPFGPRLESMSELADLLELLYRAHRSFTTIRGEMREWRDIVLGERAREALMQREQRSGLSPRARTVMLYGQAAGPEELPARLESTVRFWLEPPQRVREEWQSAHPYGQNGVIGVRDGERWWRYDPRTGAVSNQDDPEVGSGIGQWLEQLTDPVDLLAGLDLVIERQSEQAGRAALAVRATPRPLANPVVHQFPHGADEFRFLVDRERGILLRRAMLFEGQELSASELVELTFDERFPPHTFTLELPEGETFENVHAHQPEHVTLEQAAGQASFPVLALPRLPEGNWRTMVIHVAPRQRPPVAETVVVNYMREDAGQHIQLHESPLGGQAVHWAVAAPAEPETVERDGINYALIRGEPGRPGRPSLVLFNRDTTSIRLSSDDLAAEQLLELAATLAPI